MRLFSDFPRDMSLTVPKGTSRPGGAKSLPKFGTATTISL